MPAVIRLDIAQDPLLHHVDGAEHLVADASLLRADHEQLVRLLAGVADQLVLFERERQRLLAKDVLAGLQGLDGDFDVPMVGRDDAHHVDIVALQHLAIIAVAGGLAFADAGVVLGPLGMAGVDVTDGHDIGEHPMLQGVAGALFAQADAAEPRPVVGRGIGKCRLAPAEIGDRAARGPRRYRLLQKITPGIMVGDIERPFCLVLPCCMSLSPVP